MKVDKQPTVMLEIADVALMVSNNIVDSFLYEFSIDDVLTSRKTKQKKIDDFFVA
jgi:hypothetical protein